MPPDDACPRCRGPLVAIEIPISGKALRMRSCSKCDVRFWSEGDKDVDLTDVLGHEPARQPALR
jgi:hypothetical protein